eukprot:2201696-Rhodomonas_salina.2
MSGTELAYGAPGGRAGAYAVSGTDLAYAGVRGQLQWAYSPTRCAVLTSLAMRCAVLASRFPLRACYALRGTDLAYPPTRLLCAVRY